MVGCITCAKKCFNGVLALCVSIEIFFIDSFLMHFGMAWVGGDTSDGFGFCGVCIACLTVVLNSFDCQNGDVECMLEHLPYEFGMVTPSECCVSIFSEEGDVFVGIMSGVFSHVTRWYLRGAIRILVAAVGVDEVLFVVVDVGVTFCAVLPFFVANCCNASP